MAAHQAPPSLGFSRQKHWSGLPFSFSNAWKWKVKVKSLSRVQPFATPWTVAHQAPPSMGFFRQEYWSGLPFPSPGSLAGKESSCNEGYLGSIPGLGRSPGHGNPFQYCLENHHGQRSLVGYSPWGHRVGLDWAIKHSTTVSIIKYFYNVKNSVLLLNMHFPKKTVSCFS